jgi:guanine deaminase
LVPGFIDTHIHAPQFAFTGTGYDLELLDWLEKYTFPTESKFSDAAIAEDVYSKVVTQYSNLVSKHSIEL